MAEENFVHFMGGGVKSVGLARAAPAQPGRARHEPKAPRRATEAPPARRRGGSPSVRSVARAPDRRVRGPGSSGVRVGPSAGAGPAGRGERAKRATEARAQRARRGGPRRCQYHRQLRSAARVMRADPKLGSCRDHLPDASTSPPYAKARGLPGLPTTRCDSIRPAARSNLLPSPPVSSRDCRQLPVDRRPGRRFAEGRTIGRAQPEGRP
jgi:hypothetical protein